jgi:DNA polymerase II small subunit/DNA polymerase delta subunit B
MRDPSLARVLTSILFSSLCLDVSLPQKTFYPQNQKCRICDLEMSGIEISAVEKERDTHSCTSCVTAVVQMFCYFRDQNRKLRSENENLEEEIMKLRRVGEEQVQVMAEEIKAMAEELVMLKKESKSFRAMGG